MSNFRLVVVFIAIAFTLGACSGRTRPFGKDTNTFSARLLKAPPVIKIDRIEGLSTANSQSLRRQIIREARQRGISVKSNDKGKAAVFVNGTLKVAPYGSNTAVAYVWDVSDKNNNRLMRVTGEDISQKTLRNQNATHLSGKTIQRIAAHATSSMASWLGRQGYRVRDVSLPPPSDVRNASILQAEASSVAARKSITRNLYKTTNATPIRVVELSSPQLAQPRLALPQTEGAPTITGSISGPRALRPEKQPVIVLVEPVTGASTQANIELTQAIKRALRTKGVRITESPTPSALKLVGIVTLGPISQQRRVIEINWNLNNALGQKIGLIQQKNKVQAALVANSWGRTADLAAQAAARDIAGIIPGNTKTAQR